MNALYTALPAQIRHTRTQRGCVNPRHTSPVQLSIYTYIIYVRVYIIYYKIYFTLFTESLTSLTIDKICIKYKIYFDTYIS